MRPLATWPPAAAWILLLGLSAALFAAWQAVHLPAGFLLGPMLAGILLGAHGVRLDVPRLPYLGGQAVIGALVASIVTPGILATYAQHWWLFSSLIGATMLGAALLGWLISRSGMIAGVTAVFGISPGAAGSMIVQGEVLGADIRLVAFMQYSRVVLVALAAALVSHQLGGASAAASAPAPWFAPMDWRGLGLVLLIALAAQQLGRAVRLPAWAVLGPMLVLSVLHAGGWLPIVLPRWLLALSYALVGWHVGLDFHRDILQHALRALPAVLGATAVLIAWCWALALLLVRVTGTDVLTAYLATCPGSFDSVAIIAAASPQVDLPFVMAVQTVRLVFVTTFAPLLSRLVVRYTMAASRQDGRE